MTPSQSFLGFEQQTRDAELAAAAAKLQAKPAEQAQRAIRKRQEEMDKNHRRWKREEATRKRNDILVAQCGINWTTLREAHSPCFGNHFVAGEGSLFPPPRCGHLLDALQNLRPVAPLHRRQTRQAPSLRRSQTEAAACPSPAGAGEGDRRPGEGRRGNSLQRGGGPTHQKKIRG